MRGSGKRKRGQMSTTTRAAAAQVLHWNIVTTTRRPWLNCLFLSLSLSVSQVMETKDMLYIVTEYAKNGEMFGEYRVRCCIIQ